MERVPSLRATVHRAPGRHVLYSGRRLYAQHHLQVCVASRVFSRLVRCKLLSCTRKVFQSTYVCCLFDESVVCRLILGFIVSPDGRVSSVSDSNFQLFQTGEDGNDPDHSAFHFTAGAFTAPSTLEQVRAQRLPLLEPGVSAGTRHVCVCCVQTARSTCSS